MIPTPRRPWRPLYDMRTRGPRTRPGQDGWDAWEERRAGRRVQRPHARTVMVRRLSQGPGYALDAPADLDLPMTVPHRLHAIRLAQHAAAPRPAPQQAPPPTASARTERSKPFGKGAAILGATRGTHDYQVVRYQGSTYVMDYVSVTGGGWTGDNVSVWVWIYRSRTAAIRAMQHAHRARRHGGGHQAPPAAGHHRWEEDATAA